MDKYMNSWRQYLNEQSYEEKTAKMAARKKINKSQLLAILPVGKTATIMQADGVILIVDENNNYYELI